MVIPLIPMDELAFEHPLITLGLLHCLVGGLATWIAHRKGYPLKPSLLIGLIGGTPSLIWALTRPRRPADADGN